MAPRKKSSKPSRDEGPSSRVKVKRVTKSDIERKICKRKLDSLEQEESQIKEDRFSAEEKRCLLEAYHKKGFQVFNDPALLHQFLPHRREIDLKGLLERLKINIQASFHTEESKSAPSDPLDDWEKLCHKLIGNFAKDRKINLDEIISDALLSELERKEIETLDLANSDTLVDEQDESSFNYSQLLRSFAQMLMGNFPDSMNAATRQVSIKLYEHINNLVSSIADSTLTTLEDGVWLQEAVREQHLQQELALKGLKELEATSKKCPTERDLEKNKNIEALCLELPKIKRITDVLNPLHLNESLVSTLMKNYNDRI